MHANEINRCCEFLLHELCASVCVCVCGTHTRDTIHAYIRGVYTIRWNAKCNFNAIESIQNINGMKCTTHDSSSHKHSHTHTRIMVTRPPTLIRCRMNIHMNVVCFVYFQCRIFWWKPFSHISAPCNAVASSSCVYYTHDQNKNSFSHSFRWMFFTKSIGLSIFIWNASKSLFSYGRLLRTAHSEWESV